MQRVHRLSLGASFILRRNTPFLFHYILFIVSFVFGLLTVVFDFAFNGGDTFAELLSKTVNNSYLTNFLSYLFACLIMSTTIVLCGFFTFGAPLSVAVFIAYGLGNGAMFAFVCRQCGAVGIAVNLALFLVPSVLTFIMLTLISSSSAYVSTGLAAAVFSNRSLVGIKGRISDMMLLHAFSVPCFAALSAVRALFIMIFSGVFFT